jgi:SAM-dependent methyltransferase
MTFALLVLPSANRVYTESAAGLTQAELRLFGDAALGGRITGVEVTAIGGVPYVTFDLADPGERDLAVLANLSSIYALFRREDELLRPVPLRPMDRYDDDLLTILKYQGKTNEQFTKLLLNVTLLSTAFAGELLDRRFSVLDPLCGRGTTLNQALMYGYHAAGIDLDGKDFEAYSAFIQTWLKRKRIKHDADAGRVRRDRRIIARRLHVEIGPPRQARQHLDYVNVDTTRAGEFHRPDTFDVVVADAPYGVQHGSRTERAGLARSPLDLLTDAVPVWARLLRPGGALGISWNTHVARRADATAVLAHAGLEPLDDGPYLGFAHRVDQAINRDILVARKPVG